MYSVCGFTASVLYQKINSLHQNLTKYVISIQHLHFNPSFLLDRRALLALEMTRVSFAVGTRGHSAPSLFSPWAPCTQCPAIAYTSTTSWAHLL